MNSDRPLIGPLAAVCLLAATVYAAPTVNVGTHQLFADTPNQTIDVWVSGGDAVQGVTFRIQVADGGTAPGVGGSIDGPAITDVDLLTDTIFDGNNTGQVDVLAWDQIRVLSTTTADGTVTAEGRLARVTLDTTGFLEGTFALSLHDTRDGATDFAGIPIDILDGSIQIVPVPEPAGLGWLGVGLTCWYARRRRLPRTTASPGKT